MRFFNHLLGDPDAPPPPPKPEPTAFDPVAWLEKMGVKDIDDSTKSSLISINSELEKTLDAVDTITAQRKALTMAKAPPAVRRTVGTLSTHDWLFTEHIQEIRGYAVNKLLEEVENSRDGRVRLKALELLGKITEVGLFTEQVKVARNQMSDKELDKQIQERLKVYATLSKPASVVEGEIVLQNATAPESPMLEEKDGPTAD
ncbi:MAG TPA: hypothetical protein PLQ34_07845 [Ferrovaceae bacterium]|nr:hypothetical protein [Ferrovaceae bacterium]